jgi:hypothetical protein
MKFDCGESVQSTVHKTVGLWLENGMRVCRLDLCGSGWG